MPHTIVTLYTRGGCHLCEQTKQDLTELQNEYHFILKEVDIDQSDELTELYGLMIPVVHVNGKEAAFGQIHKKDIINRLHKIVKS